jgi:hypothetical protein
MIAMGEIMPFPKNLIDNHELIADLCRFAEGIFSESEVKKRHRLPDAIWQQMADDDLLIEKIEAEKVRRIRDGSAKREKAQKHIIRAPDVLSSIMDNPNANERHRVDAIKTLDGLAANGPEKAPAADRFVISIVLNGDVEHYNKSIAIDANDVDPNDVPQITTTKKDSDDE